MRFRVIFEYSRIVEAENIKAAREKAEWLRVGIGSYTIEEGRSDPDIRVEIKHVIPAIS